jgi:hypothetical protein
MAVAGLDRAVGLPLPAVITAASLKNPPWSLWWGPATTGVALCAKLPGHSTEGTQKGCLNIFQALHRNGSGTLDYSTTEGHYSATEYILQHAGAASIIFSQGGWLSSPSSCHCCLPQEPSLVPLWHWGRAKHDAVRPLVHGVGTAPNGRGSVFWNRNRGGAAVR